MTTAHLGCTGYSTTKPFHTMSISDYTNFKYSTDVNSLCSHGIATLSHIPPVYNVSSDETGCVSLCDAGRENFKNICRDNNISITENSSPN